MQRAIQRIRWDEVLEQARVDSLPVGTMTVTLYDDGNFHHGSQFCGQNTRPVELAAGLAIDTVVPVWCECGGWLGTRFGGLLQAVREQYRAIEDETSELRHTDWSAAWHAFKTLGSYPSWAYRSEDTDLENLRHRTRLATLTVLEKSRPNLPIPDLERRIAAQGLRVPVVPADGVHLRRWADDLRIDTPQQNHQGNGHPRQRCPYDDMLDDALEQARHRNDRVLVVIIGGRGDDLPIDTSLPAELALLLWALDVPARTTQLLHLPRPVGDGLANLAPKHLRIGVAHDDERDPETLEAVRALCEDAYGTGTAQPGGRGTQLDLDGILATSRML